MKIYKVEYESDIYYVYFDLLKRGYSVTLKEAEQLWLQFSNSSYCANCMNPRPELLDEFEEWIKDEHEIETGD